MTPKLATVPEPGGAGPGLEALLAPGRRLVLEQQGEPLGMLQALGLGLSLEIAEGRGHALQVEGLQQIEGGMGEHEECFLQWK